MQANSADPRRRVANPINLLLPRGAVLLILVLLPLVLAGSWREMTGKTINTNLVQRIQDGKTTQHEIVLYFGEPQETHRTPQGKVFIYKSYKDAPAMPYRHEKRKINPQSDQIMVIDADRKIKKAPLKTEGKILFSTLTIRFKPDGQTVMSHVYKEFKKKED